MNKRKRALFLLRAASLLTATTRWQGSGTRMWTNVVKNTNAWAENTWAPTLDITRNVTKMTRHLTKMATRQDLSTPGPVHVCARGPCDVCITTGCDTGVHERYTRVEVVKDTGERNHALVSMLHVIICVCKSSPLTCSNSPLACFRCTPGGCA